MMACDCINNQNEKLRERYNKTAHVNNAYHCSDGTTRVIVEGHYRNQKKDGRYYKTNMVIWLDVDYCPFCGKKYLEKEGGDK